jgi:hypothetical protein
MHPTVLVQRRATALAKLVQASNSIVTHLELDPELLSGFTAIGVKDNQVKDMMALEAAAAVMFQLGLMSGAIEEGVTAVTEPEAEEAALPQPVLEESAAEPGTVSTEESVEEPNAAEELPAAEPEEALSPAEEVPAEDPGEQSLPAEEAPAKSSKKSTSSKRSRK